jgi:hypothetical protein
VEDETDDWNTQNKLTAGKENRPRRRISWRPHLSQYVDVFGDYHFCTLLNHAFAASCIQSA